MRLSQIIFLIVFTAIIVSVDIFLNRWTKNLDIKYKSVMKYFSLILFKISPAIFLLSFLSLPLLNSLIPAEEYMSYVHSVSGMFFLIYLPKIELILFIALENLVLLLIKLYNWFRKKKLNLEKIKRRVAIVNKIGFFVASFVFLAVIYGIQYGKFDFIVREVEINSPVISEEFEDFTIAHITDFHLGGFWGHEEKVDEIVELINSQNPDIIVFTGDMVNNVSEELEKFVKPLSKLKSKYGNFSILGNHDYGDYIKWENTNLKIENLNRLKALQDSAGFKLLLNEFIPVIIKNDTLNLIGVENWGMPPFPQYGNLSQALQNVNQEKFDILLSHDPTHWEAEV